MCTSHEKQKGRNKMSKTLHAFKDYKVIGEGDNAQITYIGDNMTDLTASTWCHITSILELATKLSGCEIDIWSYDEFEDIDLARERKLKLIEPEVFSSALEKVKTEISGKEDKISKNMLCFIENVLLPRAKAGLYFVKESF